jgi:hypothetical protein
MGEPWNIAQRYQPEVLAAEGFDLPARGRLELAVRLTLHTVFGELFL